MCFAFFPQLCVYAMVGGAIVAALNDLAFNFVVSKTTFYRKAMISPSIYFLKNKNLGLLLRFDERRLHGRQRGLRQEEAGEQRSGEVRATILQQVILRKQ